MTELENKLLAEVKAMRTYVANIAEKQKTLIVLLQAQMKLTESLRQQLNKLQGLSSS